MGELGHFKDEGLNRLSNQGYNTAQFASFDPQGRQRYSRVIGQDQNYDFGSQEATVRFMLEHTTEHSVNVRSFAPDDPKSKPFDYGLTSVNDVLASLKARRDEGLHTILNETVDIDDGGVSGVAIGNIIEFTPHDTPRGVEKKGVAQFSRAMAANVIHKVYGFYPELTADPTTRIEFSVHPKRHGNRDDHTIIWEAEPSDNVPLQAETHWPNNFSDMLGDKTFGLVVADEIGLRVPRTTVFNRTVAPFTFGHETGSSEAWLRTAPNKQTPGLYTTTHGWIDPFKLMQQEDPTGENIASILRQDGVDAKFSGACLMGADGRLILEGKSGKGDTFMVGEQGVSALPDYVQSAVTDVYKNASGRLGPVRFEWVYDGTQVWVVQLHRGESISAGETIVPGDESTAYIPYQTETGIDGLRALIANHLPGTGIMLVGNVGISSHMGDLLRKANIPSRIQRKSQEKSSE